LDKYEILFSIDAREDIEEITRYIKEVLALPELASIYREELLATIKELEFMPNRFEKVDTKYIKRNNIRKIIYKNHLTLYATDEEKRKVYVLRVRHGKTDWKDV